MALQTADRTLSWSLTLAKETRSRLEEERLTADFVLALLAQACQVDTFPIPTDSLRDEESLAQRESTPPPGGRELLLGKTSTLRLVPGLVPGDESPSSRTANSVDTTTTTCAETSTDSTAEVTAEIPAEIPAEVTAEIPANTGVADHPVNTETASSKAASSRESLLLFPGAFNPPHDGHRKMAEWAERKTGLPVQFEISLENVDKPMLDYQELSDRLAYFRDEPNWMSSGRVVWLTRAPTFVVKSLLFPAATFLVGLDTAIRIADPRYYADEMARDEALATIRRQGCRFLVFGRIVKDQFQTLDQVVLPESLRALCSGISEEEFRDDHSSSAIRRQQQHSTSPND